MKISNHILDAITRVIDVLTLAYLAVGSAIAVFAKLMPAVPDDDEDPVADDYDPGAIWDRAYDRAVDESNGVV